MALKIRYKAITGVFISALVFCGATGVSAATDPAVGDSPTQNFAGKELTALRGIEKLNDILDILRERRSELKEKKAELEKAVLENDKKTLTVQIETISSTIDDQQRSFELIATGGLELDSLTEREEKPFDWQKGLLEIIRPIMSELRKLTEKRRKMEMLRNRLAVCQDQNRIIDEALKNIVLISTENLKPATLTRLKNVRKQWEDKQRENHHLIEVVNLQLEEMAKTDKTLDLSFSDQLKGLLLGRGGTLFMALFAAIGVYIGLHLSKSLVKKAFHLTSSSSRPVERFIGLNYQLVSVLLSIVALFYVFHIRGDKVMQGVAILMLVGIFLVLKNSIPRYIDEIKLILNVGPVRVGERVVYSGLPWRVDSLDVFSSLTNPALSVPTLRTPLKSLIGLESRESHPDEAWFPCNVGSYVLLSDEVFGRVKTITVDSVTLVVGGGAIISYTISDFLGATPKNLDTGFTITITFGLSYDLQRAATAEIPELMRTGMRERLEKESVGEHLSNLLVQFEEAAASSLNYKVIAIFRGSGASEYLGIPRILQRLSVDLCNEQGWEIPFTQIVVHRGGAEGVATGP